MVNKKLIIVDIGSGEELERLEKRVLELKDLRGKAPRLFGIPTRTKLDEMFFTVKIDEKPLDGIMQFLKIKK